MLCAVQFNGGGVDAGGWGTRIENGTVFRLWTAGEGAEDFPRSGTTMGWTMGWVRLASDGDGMAGWRIFGKSFILRAIEEGT